MRADRPTAAHAPTPHRGHPAVHRKASASAGEKDCVEVAELPHGARAVRDSKNPEREPLRFTASEWAAFRGA
ncbi:DUF397 domain-containing protein [Streptomyces niger]|uniref:DUF397 domain-containing protein n=1 Tax=Streptomyces niger TaxID=66373 RepID=UPI002D21BD53|nr:DUF397 domain-containing protein [Streptomyces niger]